MHGMQVHVRRVSRAHAVVESVLEAAGVLFPHIEDCVGDAHERVDGGVVVDLRDEIGRAWPVDGAICGDELGLGLWVRDRVRVRVRVMG